MFIWSFNTEHQQTRQNTQLSICWVAWIPGLNWLCFAFYSLECQTYQSLTSAKRKITYYITVNYACDNTLGPGWFRFQGAAGSRMPTSCPPIQRCNTYATGWINGGHPTVADGKVTRQVCFHYWSNCCQSSTNIKVRNCGSFYVYHLNGTDQANYCHLGYCGTD